MVICADPLTAAPISRCEVAMRAVRSSPRISCWSMRKSQTLLNFQTSSKTYFVKPRHSSAVFELIRGLRTALPFPAMWLSI